MLFYRSTMGRYWNGREGLGVLSTMMIELSLLMGCRQTTK